MRTGDSIVIDPATRKVTHVNGEPVTKHTPEMDALVEEFLGPAPLSPSLSRQGREGKTKNSEVDI